MQGRVIRVGAGWVALAGGLALAGCSGAPKHDKPPPEIGFRVIEPGPVPLEIELPGRVTAQRTAEVRPQVSGVIQQRLFQEGALVHAGQPLFRIDSSLYSATARQAEANLAAARATAAASAAKAERYRPLAAEQAVSQQDYADALAAARSGRAAIAQSSAALATARINLRYTTVPAPLTGRIGRALFTQGALVTSGQADPLAVISVLDPVNVDLQESAADLIRLRRQLGQGSGARFTAPVRLILDDGSDYGLAGTLEFSEVTADPATGSVTLRARFPNPRGLLLPGLYVRARVSEGVTADAFLVPQAALVRDPKGQSQVWVVARDNTATLRPVTAERTQGDAWVVTAGLSRGDRVITQGIGKLKPGLAIHPVPESAPQRIDSAAHRAAR